jgi:hypothetical protein
MAKAEAATIESHDTSRERTRRSRLRNAHGVPIRAGLPRVRLTFHVWGFAPRKDGCHAEEVPSGVQA